jgi:hypothetical protein
VDSILSQCAWHVKRAVEKYFKEHNQRPWATSHKELDYMDTDRQRGWDAGEFLQHTGWVKAANELKEELWSETVTCAPGFKNITPEERQKKLHKAGEKKRLICIADKDTRNLITDLFMTHLHFHPYVYTAATEPCTDAEIKGAWMDQVTEMYNTCLSKCESWAWEYLWKHWYRPGRWELWARAICDEIPIVQSNAMVESVWSVLKRRYLRRFNRAKLEFLVDIIMNMHIPRTIQRVEAYRNCDVTENPPW